MLCVLKGLHYQVSNAYFMRNVSLIVFVLSLIVYIYFLIIVMFLSSIRKKHLYNLHYKTRTNKATESIQYALES